MSTGRAHGAGTDPAQWPAVEALAHMANGDLSAERYAEALLARCAAAESLNALITLHPEQVREDARACDLARRSGTAPGPLFGLPIPIKDSINTRDYVTTGGTPALRHCRPSADAPVVARLRAAGAFVLGKTNLHELSFGWTSDNRAYGSVRNPYDPSRIPGGSSGGTAAAVAARLAPLGLAEDTEGSIRVPAALCGIQGFRPTTGRYPTQACIPISPLFDQVGPHARCTADLVLFDSVITGQDLPLSAASLRGLRFGVVRDYWFDDLDPEVERLTERALKQIESAGGVLVESQLPDLRTLIKATTAIVQNHDLRPALAGYLAAYVPALTWDEVFAAASPDIQITLRREALPGGTHFPSEASYAAARDRHLPALRRLFRDYFAREGVAAIVFPTTLTPAPRIGADHELELGGRRLPFETAIARNIAPGSTAGLPGLVLPIGLSAQGLPVSLEFDAASGADRQLLALGLALEKLFGPLPAPAFAPP